MDSSSDRADRPVDMTTDENAFDPNDIDTAVEMYSTMIYRLALSRLGNPEDAEDVTQEVFMRFVKNQPDLQSEEHRKAWFLRVTINCSINLATSAYKRYHAAFTDELMAVTAGEGGVFVEDDFALNLIMQLPQKYRQALHLFYYEELSVSEIAAVMGNREGTVKSLLHRGRAKLRVLWEKWEAEYEG